MQVRCPSQHQINHLKAMKLKHQTRRARQPHLRSARRHTLRATWRDELDWPPDCRHNKQSNNPHDSQWAVSNCHTASARVTYVINMLYYKVVWPEMTIDTCMGTYIYYYPQPSPHVSNLFPIIPIKVYPNLHPCLLVLSCTQVRCYLIAVF